MIRIRQQLIRALESCHMNRQPEATYADLFNIILVLPESGDT